jgi:two-component system chemotaxis sensor kinase CheA
VERLHDTVEIVVKPLGRHVQGIRDYAGATILGDGHVALILDVSGLATRAGLSISRVETMTRQAAAQSSQNGEMHSLLLFQNGPVETCALPIELVSRIERIRPAQIEHVGGRRTMQYRGASLPLVALRDVASVDDFSDEQRLAVIVFDKGSRPLGLLAAEPIDMVEAALSLDQMTLRQRGVAGSAVIRGRTTLMVDIFEVAEAVLPDAAQGQANFAAQEHGEAQPTATVLLAEDSDFFRSQIKRMIEAVGYRVLAAEDGQAAWELLDRHADEVQVVATDIEMPRMDGLSFTRQIRAESRFT